MDIAVTGSHGLIGRALVASLRADGHRVRPVVRSTGEADSITWDPAAGTVDRAGLEGLDAVVHLAGEGIASRPWTAKQRARIHDSRSKGTTLLSDALAGLERPPSVLVSGSAIGYYGDRGDELLDERSTPGDDFLAQVCLDWEQPTRAASAAGIRTVLIRTGIVLDPSGGSLGAQLLPFKLGLGAQAGKGEQWLSWITLDDEVAAIRHALAVDAVTGPVNVVAPNPVTNATFTDAVGAALHRPTFLVIPRVVQRLPLGVGDLVGSLLFSSARVNPATLTETGFTFAHPELPGALDHLFAR